MRGTNNVATLHSTHLPSWIAIVIFVLVTTSKILRIPLLYLLVCQSLTDTLRSMQTFTADKSVQLISLLVSWHFN